MLAFVNWKKLKSPWRKPLKQTNPIHLNCAALCILMFWRTCWRKVSFPLCHPCFPEDSNQKLDKGLTCLTNQSPCLLNEPQTCFSSCWMDILWTSSERKEVIIFFQQQEQHKVKWNNLKSSGIAVLVSVLEPIGMPSRGSHNMPTKMQLLYATETELGCSHSLWIPSCGMVAK